MRKSSTEFSVCGVKRERIPLVIHAKIVADSLNYAPQ
jgi:hypothetical protein